MYRNCSINRDTVQRKDFDFLYNFFKVTNNVMATYVQFKFGYARPIEQDKGKKTSRFSHLGV